LLKGFYPIFFNSSKASGPRKLFVPLLPGVWPFSPVVGGIFAQKGKTTALLLLSYLIAQRFVLPPPNTPFLRL